jgi:hypothetical protein
MNHLNRSVLVLLALVTLAACGGGGGGDDSPAPTPPNPGGFQVSVDRTSVSFEFDQGTLPNPFEQVLNATWTGTPPAQVFVGATIAGTGLLPTIPIDIGATSATISLRASANLVGGTYTGTVNLLVCADALCNQRIGGTPIVVNYTINVRTPVFTGPVSIDFAYTRGTTVQQVPVALNVLPAAGAWTASADDSFITLSKTSGNGADTVMVFFDPGTRSSSRPSGRVTITGASGTQSVPVTLDLTTPVINVFIPNGQPNFNFVGTNGAPFAPMTIGVSLNTGGMPLAVSSDVPWGTVSNVSTSTNGQFTLTLNPAVGPLARGLHEGTIRIEVGNGNFNVVQDFLMQLQLLAPVLASVESITLGGPVGRHFDQIPFQFSLNTGPNSYPWTVLNVPPWLQLDRTSGTVSAAGQQILFEPRRLESFPGTATANLIFRAQVNGDTVDREVDVSFNLDTHRLIATENGIAFVTTSDVNWRRTSHVVRLRDNLRFTRQWTATDDQPWLTTTAAGDTDDNLVITANAAGLADGLHLATITVDPTEAAGETIAQERIRVGFWVSSGAPPSAPLVIGHLMEIYNTLRADPIRPYVYAHQTNGNQTSIRTFNVYTGAEVLPAITGISPDTIDLGVSTDGSQLFAFDREAGVIARVDLDTRTVVDTFPAPRTNFSATTDQIKYARPNGVDIILRNSGDAYDPALGQRIGNGPNGYFDVTQDHFTTYAGAIRGDIDYTSAQGGTFIYDFLGTVDVNLGNSQDTATNIDGSIVTATGTGDTVPQYGFRQYNGLSMEPLAPLPHGVAFPNNVERDVHNRLYTSSDGKDSNGHNLWIYNDNNDFTGGFDIAMGIANRGLVVSGDGFIVMINRGLANPGIERFLIGPP